MTRLEKQFHIRVLPIDPCARGGAAGGTFAGGTGGTPGPGGGKPGTT